MKLLELFSGTGSVGRVAKEKGFEVISLDLKNADINCDIYNGIIKYILVGILILCFVVGYFDFMLRGCKWQNLTQATTCTS